MSQINATLNSRRDPGGLPSREFIMGVTQKQIAERLNLSQSLVARALKGYTQVSDETRGLIEQTALEMGYNLGDNREARALIAKRYGTRVKTGVIAVATSPGDLSSGPGLETTIVHMPHLLPLIGGVENEAARYNIDVCLCVTRKDEVPRLVRGRSVDGVITLGYHSRYFKAIRELGVPLVTLYNLDEHAHGVVANEYDGAHQLTCHLLELGHRRIGFLGVSHESGQPCDFRIQGYRAAMSGYGITVPAEWITTEYEMPFGDCCDCGVCAVCRGWESLLSQNSAGGQGEALPFTALICYNDTIAMGVINKIQAAGFEVPRDISVAGFDDVSGQREFQPLVTSVGYSLSEMAHSAMQLLLEIIEKPLVTESEEPCIHRMFPVQLAVHESTGPPPDLAK